ncbi:MAG: hypothetical protein US31_C0004G0044 [Berkelbacteria bacterium GW2011_GWA1_36_9]|uniref:Glycosyltransferase RgtA/B/C/D-like domain-containing protein n=1 Tax=Berkelbacteria bacterium GW2011_GWA1_36_9 TaxID=1618331 RepID=A0A0G0FKW5_9BACT|nr:MAG: hypothetical protein US31_C0004G0044 [Berkelbacteria bacterium GW2011_GWA1_36_9]
MGYNAYSLFATGLDRYGKSLPILFRSLGSFQLPLYTYLSIPPLAIFGPSISAIKLVSVISGIVAIVTSFFFVLKIKQYDKFQPALFAAFFVAISPWAIFFSRTANEANLGLALFSAGILLSLVSLSYPKFFLASGFILGLAPYAYYAERFTTILFLSAFCVLFLKTIRQNIKWAVWGFAIFIILQLPFFTILGSNAGFWRMGQVNYFSDEFFVHNGGNFVNVPFGKAFFILREFMSQYLTYFSPRNLFFDADPQGVRSMPDISVFYSWMIIPFFFGLKLLLRQHHQTFAKILLLLIIILPIPAALTKDPFYTTRVLPLLWSFTIIISLGFYRIFVIIKPFILRFSVLSVLVIISFTQLYLSYFVLLKYERSDSFGLPFLELARISQQYSQMNIVVDSTRQPEAYIWLAFFKKYDPKFFQGQVKPELIEKYYQETNFQESYKIDNMEVRPIVWEKDIYRKQIIVGDKLAVSDKQIKEHRLNEEFQIKDLAGDIKLIGYSTNPEDK